MLYFKKNVIPIQAGQSGFFFVNLPSQSAPSGPTTGNDDEPFDLTGATEIIASFPGGVNERLSLDQVAIEGSDGCGKIKVNYSALDSLTMQVNPVAAQNQDLQVVATLNGVAQVDTLSISGGAIANTTYTATINGTLLTYTAVSGDTAQTVFTALLAQLTAAIAASPISLPIEGEVEGSGNGATLVLTSTFPALAFNDVVSSSVTKTATTPNSGSIAVWLFKFALNIQPQSYPVN